MLTLGGGMHYLLMIMAAAAASKWADDEEISPCSCLQYNPVRLYAFIRKNREMAAPEAKQREFEVLPTTVQPERKKVEDGVDAPIDNKE